MPSTSRRHFLAQTASLSTLAMAGCAALNKPGQESAAVPPPRRGANEKIRVAVAGIHGQGGTHIKGYAAMKDV